MVTINIDGKDYHLRTSWKDVPYSFYAELKNPFAEEMKLIKKVSYFTGIEPEIINSLSFENLDMIIKLVMFMETDITEFNKVEINTEIAKETWFKLEKSKQIFQKEPNPYLAIAQVVKEYTNFDMMDKSVTEVYHYADFFFHNSTLLTSGTKG